ncbi:hypothetical protein J4225_04040 [Candidatus Pacearchaeota archaeon]|nr:hypothetical protein [Candidatus Pacearchaeota archaeon]
MKEDDIVFLKQLVESLNEAESKLREAYYKKDSEEFNKIKKFMLQINRRMSDAIK